MPTFEFRCVTCAIEFEHLSVHSSEEVCCPDCGTVELERLLSASAVSSKGTRARALTDARKRAGKLRHEKEWEQHKQEHHHHH